MDSERFERPALPEVLIPTELAALFRVDVKTITRWAAAGKIPFFRTLGGHRRFRREDVLAFLGERREGGHE